MVLLFLKLNVPNNEWFLGMYFTFYLKISLKMQSNETYKTFENKTGIIRNENNAR